MKSEAFNFTLRRNGNQDFWHLIFKCKSHSVAETQFLFIPHNQEQMAFSVSWSKITCETGGKHRYVYRYTLESRKLHFEKYTSRLIPLMILITYCQIIEKLFQHPWLSFYSKFPSLRAETEAAWWHTIRYFFFSYYIFHAMFTEHNNSGQYTDSILFLFLWLKDFQVPDTVLSSLQPLSLLILQAVLVEGNITPALQRRSMQSSHRIKMQPETKK